MCVDTSVIVSNIRMIEELRALRKLYVTELKSLVNFALYSTAETSREKI